MNFKEELLNNINKIHTTELGTARIKRNLNMNNNDVVDYCKRIIGDKNSNIIKKGKNYYVNLDKTEITVNSSSFTIITAHLKK